VTTQSYWTAELTKLVQINVDVSYQVKYILWFNPLSDTSLRLTSSGFNYFANRANLKFFKHEIKEPIMPKTLLQMEKHFTYPYYIINLHFICISDQSLSTILTLYDNKLQKYLDHADELDGK
jgi:hypothetical protein